MFVEQRSEYNSEIIKIIPPTQNLPTRKFQNFNNFSWRKNA